MFKSMNQVLDEKTDEAYQLIAKVFMEGGGAKKGKANLKEVLRQVWHHGMQTSEENILNRLNDWVANIKDGR